VAKASLKVGELVIHGIKTVSRLKSQDRIHYYNSSHISATIRAFFYSFTFLHRQLDQFNITLINNLFNKRLHSSLNFTRIPICTVEAIFTLVSFVDVETALKIQCLCVASTSTNRLKIEHRFLAPDNEYKQRLSRTGTREVAFRAH
jgi:hypothetical protein